MAERDQVAAGCQSGNQVGSTVKLGRDRHDADIGSSALDFTQDVCASKLKRRPGMLPGQR